MPAAVWTLVVLGLTLTPVTDPASPAPGLDLLLHGLLFGILALLVRLASGKSAGGAAATALVTLSAFAALDELAQGAVPGRTSSWADLAADVAGILTGWLAAGPALARSPDESGPPL